MVLKTSNPYKIKEFTRLLCDTEITIEKGTDIKEVLADKDTVVLYKAMAAGENVLVEDSVLTINGKEEVEIRWKWQDLKTGSHIIWTISIAIMLNDTIKVYRGEVEAIVDRSLGMDGEAFEPFIVPLKNNPNKLSYVELGKIINKDTIDPRAMAVQNLLKDNYVLKKDIKDLPNWRGEYQNELEK